MGRAALYMEYALSGLWHLLQGDKVEYNGPRASVPWHG